MLKISFYIMAIFVFVFTATNTFAIEVKIGVLATRGIHNTLEAWQQVSDQLGADIPDNNFIIVPLEYKGLEHAVADRKIDFVVTNPAEYINFEVKYGITRIATFLQHLGDTETNLFGSVLFTKANRTDIRSLSDLKGKSLATVSETAFGSWIASRDELKKEGISINDLASLDFTGIPVDKVVMAVKNGIADVGAVRTNVLERMAYEGEIELKDFHVLNQKHVEGFPYLLSSDLYPEFPFARLKHTDIGMANKVASSLLLMHHKATSANPETIGWTVPDNYENVRKLLQKWNLPPYEDYGKVTLKESVQQHWDSVVFAVLFLLSLFLIVILRMRMIHKKIKYSNLEIAKRNLRDHHEQVMMQRDELRVQKAELEAALARVKLLEGIIPICSYCKKIRDDEDSWQQLEQYISNHSEAKFSHGVCPQCFEIQMQLNITA